VKRGRALPALQSSNDVIVMICEPSRTPSNCAFAPLLMSASKVLVAAMPPPHHGGTLQPEFPRCHALVADDASTKAAHHESGRKPTW